MAATATVTPRTVHVEHCMGTVFSIDVRDPGDWRAPIADVVRWLHHVDDVFSTYKHDSVVNRLQRAELRLDECPAEVRDVFELCADVHATTGGYFSIVVDGRLDPSALVKGWAIERASDLLRAAGSANHAVSGGGDMQLAGEAAPGRPWRVGIAHPLIRDAQTRGALATVVEGRDLAVATSGTAERGAHIVDPFTARPATELASLSVIGARLTLVDAYATAAFAMGDRARAWVAQQNGYEAFAVRPDGTAWATPGWPAARGSDHH